MRAEHPPHECFSIRAVSRLQVENCESANELWANAAAEIGIKETRSAAFRVGCLLQQLVRPCDLDLDWPTSVLALSRSTFCGAVPFAAERLT